MALRVPSEELIAHVARGTSEGPAPTVSLAQLPVISGLSRQTLANARCCDKPPSLFSARHHPCATIGRPSVSVALVVMMSSSTRNRRPWCVGIIPSNRPFTLAAQSTEKPLPGSARGSRALRRVGSWPPVRAAPHRVVSRRRNQPCPAHRGITSSKPRREPVRVQAINRKARLHAPS
jgi:hypothetical protein